MSETLHTKTLHTEVAIVGAGPAGMAAARVLTEHGIEVLLLDEGQRPGGSIRGRVRVRGRTGTGTSDRKTRPFCEHPRA